MIQLLAYSFFLCFTDPPPSETYTLSLHDALPISDDTRLQGIGFDSLSILDFIYDVESHFNARIEMADRKSTRLNSSHVEISYAVFCLKKKKKPNRITYQNNTTPKA